MLGLKEYCVKCGDQQDDEDPNYCSECFAPLHVFCADQGRCPDCAEEDTTKEEPECHT